MDYHSEHVMTLANSIIGVSVLAMPYCFKQCGIVLSILMLIISSIISRLACHFLLKSAIMARRRTFEFLAFHAFGAFGKLIIEVGIIGFLLGTCIAFFVVMGDLGPEIILEITGTKTTNTLRTSILMALALFCVLPLGLLRNVDSLTGVSKATVGFYCCLVLKIVAESAPHFFAGQWLHNVELWRPAGILQCIPIFSMALFCQTQLFEIYQAVPNASLEKMNNIIRIAVNICTCVYIFVGMFGYIAFHQKLFMGNILLSFRPSIMTDVMKMGFVLSVAFSFPLVIFPCRASLYSLIYKRAYSIHEGATTNYIPEGKFKGLTFIIVFISLVIGVLIPNIELVLGLVGSTIGVMICVLFPVTCFICMSPKNTNERILAQLILCIGILVMVLGTYANLYAIEEIHMLPTERLELEIPKNLNIDPGTAVKNEVIQQLTSVQSQELSEMKENVQSVKKTNIEQASLDNLAVNKEPDKEVQHEPPGKVESADAPSLNAKKEHVNAKIQEKDPSRIESQKEANNEKPKAEENKDKQGPVIEPVFPNEKAEEKKEEKQNPVIEPAFPETDNRQKPKPEIPAKNADTSEQKKRDEVDVEAIKKEDTELKEQEKEEDVGKLHLIDTLEKQNEVHQQLLEQQKKLIEVIKKQQEALENEKQQNDIEKVQKEKLEAVKQIESIAKKAIESLSNKDGGNVPTGSNDAMEKVEAVAQNNEETVDEKLPKDAIKPSEKAENKPLKEETNPVNMVPIPIAKSKNLTIYGEPRKATIVEDAKKDEALAGEDIIHKANEININQVDNMNINIKHEINLNVDSSLKYTPKSLMDLLKGDNPVKTNYTKDSAKETLKDEPAQPKQTNEESKDENIQAVRRDILSDDEKVSRQKRNSEIDAGEKTGKVASSFKISPDSPFLQVMTKLSDARFMKINSISFKDVDGVLKPIVGDLKSFKVAAS